MFTNDILSQYSTKEEKLKVVLNAIKKIKNISLENPDLSKFRLILALLEAARLDTSLKDETQTLIDQMLKYKFFTKIIRISKPIFENEEFLVNDKLWYVVDLIICALCNFLENSHQLCEEIIDNQDIPGMLIKIIVNEEYCQRMRYTYTTSFRKMFSHNLIDRLDDIYVANSRIFWLYSGVCNILHNLCVYTDSARTLFDLDPVKQMLHRITDFTQSDGLAISTFSALSTIAGDDTELFLVGERFIRIFLNIARYEVCRSEGQLPTEYRAWELLNILRLAGRNEDFLFRTLSAGALSIIGTVLQHGRDDPLAVKYALLLLETACSRPQLLKWTRHTVNDLDRDLLEPLALHSDSYPDLVARISGLLTTC